MRILHVVTLVTPDGAYGGPVRVALNQLAELARRGHEVELVAGHRGFDGEPPTELQGVPVRLFPVRSIVPRTGFAGLSSPGLQAYLKSRLTSLDVVQVHMARDLITLPAAAAAARSDAALVLQPHGMIDESSNPLAAVIDSVYTRRLLKAADRILPLTPIEATSLDHVARAELPMTPITNGVSVPEPAAPAVGPVDVLFLARLHPRKRAPMFVEMARRLLAEGHEARFSLVGPDEGDGPSVTRLIDEHGLQQHVSWEGALSPDDTLERMRRASVYVLPSVGEIVSMSILEAMSLGLPVVITSSNGLAETVEATNSGIVVDETVESLTEATGRLISNAQLRDEMGGNARQAITDSFSIGAVAAQLESIYGAALVAPAAQGEA
ncbi:glycosyltransferase [Herbiconiux sp. P15]|uniref:glycosyltransferase n=1 Tax=Herbiconiux liukaitaii TaxID=3342799 RepID=UPI0035B80D6A